MSENANENAEQNQQEQKTVESEPSSAQASGQTDEAFRFRTDAPAYLQGKTEQEAIDWTTNLVQEVTNMANTQSAAQMQPAVQSQQVQSSGLPDAYLMLTDPQAYQAQLVQSLTAHQQQRLAAQAAPIINAQAETALFMSKTDPGNKEVWNSYGPVIEMQVARIPAHLRTKQLYDQAAKLVQGNHVEEIAEKRAQEKYETMLSANPGIESANSGTGAPDATLADGTSAWDKIAQSTIGKAQLASMSKRELLGLIEGGGETLEGYAEKVANSTAKYDPQTGGIDNDMIRSFK